MTPGIRGEARAAIPDYDIPRQEGKGSYVKAATRKVGRGVGLRRSVYRKNRRTTRGNFLLRIPAGINPHGRIKRSLSSPLFSSLLLSRRLKPTQVGEKAQVEEGWKSPRGSRDGDPRPQV